MGYKGLIRAELKPALCGKRIFRSNIEKFGRCLILVMGIKSQEQIERAPFIAMDEVTVMPGPRGAHEGGGWET